MRLPHLILCYEFDGEPHAITIKPNGNSKKSEKSHYRSKPSTMSRIKEKAQGRKGPSQVCDEVFEEAGGIMGFTSHGGLPRNRQQVSDIKRSKKSRKDKDQVCELIMISCLQTRDSGPSTRRIQVTPEPACVVANDRQLNNLLRFCTTQFVAAVVLGIDTTFNVGDSYVTPITYNHSLLIDRQYGKPPTMVGRAMSHMQRKRKTNKYFGSSLVSLKGDLQVIGSDRDVALRIGFFILLSSCDFTVL